MSRSKKLPALHLYPGDWKKDLNVQSLDFLSRHVWFECLLLMHDSEERGVLILNGKPLGDEQIARLIGLDIPTATDCLTKIRESGTCGIREDGAIFSRRMVRDEQKRLIAVENGSKGGNPNLVNPIATGKKILSNRNAENENEIVNENGSKDLDPKKPPTIPIEFSDGTGSLGPIPEPPQTLIVAEASPWAVHAEQQLVPHDDKRLNSDSRYINAGWRPMCQYPLLWMSSSQFCDACEQLEDAGLSFDEGHFSRVFKKANAEIERLKAAGDRHDKKSAYAYITGWAKQRVIEELKSESDFERSKTYTQRSKVRNEQRR